MPTLALVGGSHIHTPNFAKTLAATDGITVKSIWEPDAKMAQERQEVAGGEIVDRPDDIWNDADIDAVVICSETDRHEELVLAAAKAKKHLFVEKPLGMKADDAYRMADAIEGADVIFQTGYFMRGNPQFRFLKQAVADRKFGRLTRCRLVNAHNGVTAGWLEGWTWMVDPKHAGCGALGDLGTHSLDLLLWITEGDELEAVTGATGTATGRHDDIDEYGEAMLRFKSGLVATVVGSWVDSGDPHKLLLNGTEGMAAITSGKFGVSSKHIEAEDGTPTALKEIGEPWPHAFDLFLKAIKGEKDVPLVKPREAAYRSAVMDAIYTGAREGKWVKPERR